MTLTTDYFARLVGTRPSWPGDMTAEEEAVMGEHFRYLRRLTAEGKVLMAGPVFGEFGLIVLRTKDKATARGILENDPSVAAGLHTFALHEMEVSLLADSIRPDRYVAEPGDRVIHSEVVVEAALSRVWNAWTTAAGIKRFLGCEARVELRPGGPFEIEFEADAPRGLRGSEGCRVLSVLPMEVVSFEWNAPPSFGELRDVRTQVVVRFKEISSSRVRVVLAHAGWGEGEEWDRLFAYFEKAWPHVLEKLRERFDD
ncbi:MAG: hypothetical protein HKN20_09115 [Gemmatimonadetes bacterium]|nr:hypothetical protein [Gemmatimonadota bacterium]